MRKQNINYKKIGKFLGFKGIVLIVVLLVVALGVCYFVLPWQVPTAVSDVLTTKDEEVSIQIKVDTCVLEDNTSIYVENDNYKSDSKLVEEHDTFVEYTFDKLPKGDFELVVLFTSITGAQYILLEVNFTILVGVEYEDLSIHFFELGNKHNGDAIYIKAGNTDILVDAGSTYDSAQRISEYIDQYVKDGVLEYVIATHADFDHIAGFVGSSSVKGIFERYDILNIIDFPKTNKTTNAYKNYEALKEVEIELGATHYYANELVKKDITLATGITLEILDNYYYYNESDDENNYSVCFNIEKNNKNFLFTGDLEQEGEEKLVELNNLEEVYLFKAGHHGSKTSSNDVLLNVIKPQVVVVTCIAGMDEYSEYKDGSFPTQTFINRIAKYTDKVYVPTYGFDDDFSSLNGDIIVDFKDSIEIDFSNNDTILKDSDWFNGKIYVDEENRVRDGSVYVTKDSVGAKLVSRRTWPTYS